MIEPHGMAAGFQGEPSEASLVQLNLAFVSRFDFGILPLVGEAHEDVAAQNLGAQNERWGKLELGDFFELVGEPRELSPSALVDGEAGFVSEVEAVEGNPLQVRFDDGEALLNRGLGEAVEIRLGEWGDRGRSSC